MNHLDIILSLHNFVRCDIILIYHYNYYKYICNKALANFLRSKTVWIRKQFCSFGLHIVSEPKKIARVCELHKK